MNKNKIIITGVLLSIAILILVAWSYAPNNNTDSGINLTDSGNVVDTNTNDTSSSSDTNNSVYDTSETTAPTETTNSDISSTPKYKADPQIGDTAEQVRNSGWGSPKYINKTTTAGDVSEQWCYSWGGYVYLDNGVVTAIQDVTK